MTGENPLTHTRTVHLPFHSILFDRPGNSAYAPEQEAPGFFTDLNLDQIVESITAGRQEYNLEPFFYTMLPTVDAVAYRQAILRDLEDKALLECIQSFAGSPSRPTTSSASSRCCGQSWASTLAA